MGKSGYLIRRDMELRLERISLHNVNLNQEDFIEDFSAQVLLFKLLRPGN